jgi:hypothetical protein
MGTGWTRARRNTAWALVTGALVMALLAPAESASEHRLTMRDARAAARAAVVQHPSYRSIRSASGLVMRACWRSGRAVRCSLYRWAPNPCALDGGDGICAQVLTRRAWLVEVRRREGRTVARVTRIVDTSAEP